MAIGKGLEVTVQFTTVATSHTTSSQVTQASGSTIVIGVVGGASAGTLTAPSDNKGNTYTPIANQVTSGGSGAQSRFWYCENASGGTGHTFTAASSGADVHSVSILEITGGATSGILDQSVAGIEDTSSPYTSNTTGTTTQAAEMAVAFVATDSNSGTETITWGNSFTQSSAAGNASFATCGLGTLTLSSTGTVQSSITSSGAGTTGAVSFLATFKELAASDTLFGQALT